MDFKVIWTPRGLDTLRQAVEFIAERNPTAAGKMGRAILRKAGLLAQQPRLGHVFHELGRDDVRETASPPYRIVYRVLDSEQAVFILTVWHGARLEPPVNPDELE
jgi:plasmid stabilization system protein ParE